VKFESREVVCIEKWTEEGVIIYISWQGDKESQMLKL